MKNKLAYLFALFALPVLANTPPEITNVRASQRPDTKLVDIYYDAADADGDALKIRVEISDNDGVKYSVPAFSLTGDIGEGVAVGANKHIVWDAGVDWDGEYSDQMRVKVFAIDAQGFPGMEWSNEIPPGGFLMGQDGGAEGSGPSRHVNITWSYWMGKYEVTCSQYCDFLNAATVSGFVVRDGTQYVKTIPGMIAGVNVKANLLEIGDGRQIRWNVNNFEVVGNNTNKPVEVSWHGALAFCRYYGYDLPTDAEWEKAARGPDNDDQDEHLVYPWGNVLDSSCARYYAYGKTLDDVGYYNGNQTPVGNDMISAYGMYDLIGNVSEWTRSYGGDSYLLENYDAIENLDSTRNRARGSDTYYVSRGGSIACDRLSKQLQIYFRDSVPPYQLNCYGFRVVRRSVNDISTARSVGVLSFESEEVGPVSEFCKTIGGVTVSLIAEGDFPEIVSDEIDGVETRVLKSKKHNVYFRVSSANQKIRAVRYTFKVYAPGISYNSIYLVSEFTDGTTSTQSDYNQTGVNNYITGSLTFRDEAVDRKIRLYADTSSYAVYLKDIEIFVTPD